MEGGRPKAKQKTESCLFRPGKDSPLNGVNAEVGSLGTGKADQHGTSLH